MLFFVRFNFQYIDNNSKKLLYQIYSMTITMILKDKNKLYHLKLGLISHSTI